jgi:hypothetical protein
LHRERERENASSTPTCCNLQLAEGEAAHSANYRGQSHAEEEVPGKIKNHNRKNVLFKFYNTVSFAAVLRYTPEQNQRNNLCHEEVPGKNKHEAINPLHLLCLHQCPLIMASSGSLNCPCTSAIAVLGCLLHSYCFLKKSHSKLISVRHPRKLSSQLTPVQVRVRVTMKLPTYNFLERTTQKTPFLHFIEWPLPSNGWSYSCLLSSHCLVPGVYITMF